MPDLHPDVRVPASPIHKYSGGTNRNLMTVLNDPETGVEVKADS
jgi:hypothetical protein